jgi:LPXTG-motif cell wall-anchored protein
MDSLIIVIGAPLAVIALIATLLLVRRRSRRS